MYGKTLVDELVPRIITGFSTETERPRNETKLERRRPGGDSRKRLWMRPSRRNSVQGKWKWVKGWFFTEMGPDIRV